MVKYTSSLKTYVMVIKNKLPDALWDGESDSANHFFVPLPILPWTGNYRFYVIRNIIVLVLLYADFDGKSYFFNYFF